MTISACQRTTWADFLAVALPRALDLAAEASFELRQSVPRDAFRHLVGPARLRMARHAYAFGEQVWVQGSSAAAAAPIPLPACTWSSLRRFIVEQWCCLPSSAS